MLAERAWKQPENTLATRHFAKHNTRAHTHKHKHTHTQNSPFVGGGLSRAGTRDGRKVFCQAPLLNSQKGTQTQAGEAAAKRRSDGDTSYLLALGHMGGTHNLSDLCSVSLLRTAHDNIIHQAIVQTDSLCFIIQRSTCSLIPGFDMQSSLSVLTVFCFFSLGLCRPFQARVSYITALLVRAYCWFAEC